MPVEPKTICTYPACRQLIPSGTGGRCEQHKRPARQRQPDTRPSSRERGYSTAWDKASRAYRREHPLCVACLARGIVKPSEHTDHVVPHEGDEGRFWDVGNWQALCAACHTRKTIRESGAR